MQTKRKLELLNREYDRFSTLLKDWLRSKLSKEKKLFAIKKIGHKEKRIVNDELHKIPKEIIDEAKKYNAIIAKGKQKNSMPFYRLKEFTCKDCERS